MRYRVARVDLLFYIAATICYLIECREEYEVG